MCLVANRSGFLGQNCSPRGYNRHLGMMWVLESLPSVLVAGSAWVLAVETASVSVLARVWRSVSV